MKFGTVTQLDPFEHSAHQNFKNLKIQHGGGRHFEKNEKSPYLDKGSTDFDQIWHGDAVRPF